MPSVRFLLFEIDDKFLSNQNIVLPRFTISTNIAML